MPGIIHMSPSRPRSIISLIAGQLKHIPASSSASNTWKIICFVSQMKSNACQIPGNFNGIGTRGSKDFSSEDSYLFSHLRRASFGDVIGARYLVSRIPMKEKKIRHFDETFHKPHSILTNSSLWQSERWNTATTKLDAPETLLGSIRLAALMVLQRRNSDAIYTVGVRPAQAYGLFCRVFGDGKRPHIASEIFLDEPDPSDLRWRVKRRVRRFALGRVDRMIVFSKAERERYSHELRLPREKLHFVPFHTNIEEPKLTPPGVYGFAAGRSLRDWPTFFAAVEGLDCEFVVVAGAFSSANLAVPRNVRLYCDIPRSRYLELLEGARFVVVPLQPSNRSAGQVVILEAGSFGKPVIASDVEGIRDYVSSDANGLLIAPGDVDGMRAAIQTLMADEILCKELGSAAFKRIEAEHQFPVFVDRCLTVIHNAVEESSSLSAVVEESST